MNALEKLIELFRQFPGIGPRQARRFAYFLLTRDSAYVGNFSSLINEMKKEIKECTSCRRFFAPNAKSKAADRCDICSDVSRERNVLMIIARDADWEVIEKSGTYRGLYFVLGGTLPILEQEPEKRIRIANLESRIEKDKNLSEIILALSANPEGEHTAEFVAAAISPIAKEKNIKISYLGRGLSTGTELEYVDPDTLKSALKNRA
jgi:recombination protein RecR